MEFASSYTVAAAVMIGSILVFSTTMNNKSSKSVITDRAHEPSKSAVLITGGSRGIGRSAADHLIQQGYTVMVTIRKQSQFDALEKEEGVAPIPVILDVTNDSHVEPAIQRVKDVLQQRNVELVAVVNNAGINPEGDAYAEQSQAGKTPENVLSDPSIASRVFETNVVGVARTTKAFLPLLKESSSGRIVTIGSYFGSITGQLKNGLSHAYYETSKVALEGLNDNMRRALAKEGIKVSLIKPGNIATDMNKVAGEVGPEVVSQDIEHAIASKTPNTRYYPGKVRGYSVWLLCHIFELFPTWLVDKL